MCRVLNAAIVRQTYTSRDIPGWSTNVRYENPLSSAARAKSATAPLGSSRPIPTANFIAPSRSLVANEQVLEDLRFPGRIGEQLGGQGDDRLPVALGRFQSLDLYVRVPDILWRSDEVGVLEERLALLGQDPVVRERGGIGVRRILGEHLVVGQDQKWLRHDPVDWRPCLAHLRGDRQEEVEPDRDLTAGHGVAEG